jgi:hypothetical protein
MKTELEVGGGRATGGRRRERGVKGGGAGERNARAARRRRTSARWPRGSPAHNGVHNGGTCVTEEEGCVWLEVALAAGARGEGSWSNSSQRRVGPGGAVQQGRRTSARSAMRGSPLTSRCRS